MTFHPWVSVARNLSLITILSSYKDTNPYINTSLSWPLLTLLLSHFSCVRPCVTHRQQPTRLPRPWDSPGKNTGVGCHFLLQCIKVKVKSLSCVRLLATPWTAAHQAPPSMGFSRQEYWNGVPLPSPLPWWVSGKESACNVSIIFNFLNKVYRKNNLKKKCSTSACSSSADKTWSCSLVFILDYSKL